MYAMKWKMITILLLAIVASVWPAAAFVPLAPAGKTDPQVSTKIYYYRPYYASPYHRPYYRPYSYYNPTYIPYYYYGCRRFYSWGYLRCVW